MNSGRDPLPSRRQMTITPRFYGRCDDLPKMIRFAQAVASRRTRPIGFHVGDLAWRMVRDPKFLPEESVALWEYPDGELAALALLYRFGPGYAVDLLVGPPAPQGRDLEATMWAWVEELIRSRTAPGVQVKLFTSALETDSDRATNLQRFGFKRDTGRYAHMLRALALPVSTPPLPEGFLVRCTTAKDADVWVRLYRQTLNPRYTMAACRRLRQSPAYCSDLNLVAVAPDGTLAGFALCWLDNQNRSGEIEPLAVLPAYRRKGVGRAVVHEALQRLQERGAEQVLACTSTSNVAAMRLYESLGFEIAAWEHDFAKLVAPK